MHTRISMMIGLLGALPAPAAIADGRRLSVEEAVRTALESNARLQAQRARHQAAADGARSVRGRLLPSVRVSEEFQFYNCPVGLLSFSPSATVQCTNTPAAMASTMPFQLRDQSINTFVVSAEQPLLGLLHLSQEYLSAARSAEATGEETHAVEAALKEAVESGYLRFFEARAAEEIAKASQQQLGEQIDVAKSKIKAGVLTNADLLRIEVAAANARQQEIQAQVQEQVERASLLALTGLYADGDAIELAEPDALLRAAEQPAPPVATAREQGLSRRPEVTAAQLNLRAADGQRRGRWLSLLPELTLEGAYVRLDGQKFAPLNSEYVGLRASWTVWEWGASFYAARAASAQAQAAAAQVEEQRRQVGFEVETRLAQSRAAATAVDVARTAIASAEEAYRVTDVLVKAGSATTTDLLDAQQALTQARLNLARARYELAIARVALTRATGG